MDVSRMSEKKLSAFRNQHIGFVFQFHHLLPEFTALENVCMPALIAGQSMTDAEKHGQRLLAMLGLDGRTEHKPSELSGGERQRVAVGPEKHTRELPTLLRTTYLASCVKKTTTTYQHIDHITI